jgi:hypothetical protein
MVETFSEETSEEIIKLNNQIAYFRMTSNVPIKSLILSLKQRVALQRMFEEPSNGKLTIIEYMGIPILPLEEVLIIE